MLDQYTDDQLLATVEGSPQAVARKDKTAWLGLFASSNWVEDPVGSKPHLSGPFDWRSGVRGKGPLERFYDTFIAPNQIRFDVTDNYVSGHTVARDLTIHLDMGQGVTPQVPMHLVYDLTEENGEARIARLAAHWELWPMIKQTLGFSNGLKVMAALGWRLTTALGIGGALGFSQGFLGIHQHGKSYLQQLAAAINFQQPAPLNALLDNTDIDISWPEGIEQVAELSAGDLQQIQLGKILSAGYTTSASFTAQYRQQAIKGLVVAEFNRRSKKIHRLRFLCGKG